MTPSVDPRQLFQLPHRHPSGLQFLKRSIPLLLLPHLLSGPTSCLILRTDSFPCGFVSHGPPSNASEHSVAIAVLTLFACCSWHKTPPPSPDRRIPEKGGVVNSSVPLSPAGHGRCRVTSLMLLLWKMLLDLRMLPVFRKHQ